MSYVRRIWHAYSYLKNYWRLLLLLLWLNKLTVKIVRLGEITVGKANSGENIFRAKMVYIKFL
jgi:hypothetical protein